MLDDTKSCPVSEEMSGRRVQDEGKVRLSLWNGTWPLAPEPHAHMM